jgi:hypothetical protein
MRTSSLLTALAAAATALPLAVLGVPTAHATEPVNPARLVVVRGAADRTVTFTADRAGENLLDLTVSAPQADWATTGSESAVVSLSVDGRYQTDVVVPSATPTPREFALGELPAGRHTLTLHLAGDRTPSGVSRAVVDDVRVTTYAPGDEEYQFLKFAPILYGRNLAAYGGIFANATTDTPLVAWHEAKPAATPGHTVLTYSVIWSNEDGGTNTPALMARWGRTTDIEWVYSVEVDENGNRVTGSDTYQGASHVTHFFAGAYEGDHALIETCTSNNNICDQITDPMRFALSYLEDLPASEPREQVMDANPWTYPVTAEEMVREGKIETPADTTTAAVSDERNYLFLTLKKDSIPVGDTTAGIAVAVTLKGSPTVYRSDHLGTGGQPSWAPTRDVPASTTIELPPDTTSTDIATVTLLRVPIGVDAGATIHATGVWRGFFLGSTYLPGASMLDWTGSVDLTPASPTATIYSAG